MSDRLFLLSYPQRMFWLLDKLEPDTPAYNLPRAFRMEGQLDTDALQEAFRVLLRRHDVRIAMLRRRVQRIKHRDHPLYAPRLQVIDFRVAAATVPRACSRWRYPPAGATAAVGNRRMTDVLSCGLTEDAAK